MIYSKFKTYSLLLFIIMFDVSPDLAAQTLDQTPRKTILILGDSLSAAYGIPINQAWVALLEKQLKKQYSGLNTPYQILNASISGETTDGGLRALPKLLEKYQPEIVIIELGANDGLRGFPLQTIEQNLAELVRMAQAVNSKVLLIGIHIPPNYGQRYAKAFHSLYSKVSQQYQTALLPFLLEGIATNPELMQDDRLHPNEKAQEAIKTLVWQQLKPMLQTN